jgi:phenylpropionate dioxygenase-like ring-hydroxylating dioxygenase large terminal subunit
MSSIVKNSNGQVSDRPAQLKSRPNNPVPAEGENGLFSQTWFPVCLSSDVARGQVIGRDFLDGRIVIFRGENGQVAVMSAYCAHLGVDLTSGSVVGNNVRCDYHRFEYEQSGKCVRTGVDGPAPPVCLFRYPVVEKYGVVAVFNGEQPLFDFPTLFADEQDPQFAEENLLIKSAVAFDGLNCDPWVVSCNTPDNLHAKFTHGSAFPELTPKATFTDYSMMLEPCHIDVKPHDGERLVLEVSKIGNMGTNLFIIEQLFNGRRTAVLECFGLSRPGKTTNYITVATPRGTTAEEQAQAREHVERTWDEFKRIILEDVPFLDHARFTQGALLPVDRTLGQYFNYLRRYPRAHPGSGFIK